MIARPRSTDDRVRRRGFTIIELSLTLVTLAVAMTLTVQVLGWVAAERRTAERRRYAAQEASNVLERFVARGYDDVSPESARSVALSEAARQVLPGAELSILVDDHGSPAGAKRVAVRLRWRQRSGEWEAPVRLTTWIERQGRGRAS